MNNTDQNELAHQAEIGKMAKGTAFIASGDILGNLLLYATSILITRTIGAQLFGLFFLGTIIIFVGAMISRLGLDYAVMRFVALYKGTGDLPRLRGVIRSSIYFTFIASGVVAIIIYFTSPWLAVHIFKKADLTPVLQNLAISLPFFNAINLIVNIFLGFIKPKYKVVIDNFIHPMVKLILISLLFLLGVRLSGVIWATVLTAIISTISCFWILFKQFPELKDNHVIIEQSKLISFAMPIYGESLLNYIIYWIDILLLGYFASSAAVGIFGIIIRLTMVLVFIQYSFNAIFSPMISEFFGRDEKHKIESLFKLQTRWSVTVTLPLLLLIILFPDQIMQVFGENFQEGALALIVMSVGRFFDAAIGTCGMMLMMVGKPKVNTINSLIILIIKVVLNLLLIPKFGLLGAAISCSSTVVLLNLMRVIEVYYLLKIHPYNIKFIKPIFSALLSLLGIVMFKMIFNFSQFTMLLVLLTAAIFLLCYFVMLYLFKLDEEDKFLFRWLYEKFV